jgi:hypothetical protein
MDIACMQAKSSLQEEWRKLRLATLVTYRRKIRSLEAQNAMYARKITALEAQNAIYEQAMREPEVVEPEVVEPEPEVVEPEPEVVEPEVVEPEVVEPEVVEPEVVEPEVVEPVVVEPVVVEPVVVEPVVVEPVVVEPVVVEPVVAEPVVAEPVVAWSAIVKIDKELLTTAPRLLYKRITKVCRNKTCFKAIIAKILSEKYPFLVKQSINGRITELQQKYGCDVDSIYEPGLIFFRKPGIQTQWHIRYNA